jgi:hypothetical protein
MDEPSGGTLRFSGHWILTNVFVTQADILTSVLSILTLVKTSPKDRTSPYLLLLIPQLRQITSKSRPFSVHERFTSELLRTL